MLRARRRPRSAVRDHAAAARLPCRVRGLARRDQPAQSLLVAGQVQAGSQLGQCLGLAGGQLQVPGVDGLQPCARRVGGEASPQVRHGSSSRAPARRKAYSSPPGGPAPGRAGLSPPRHCLPGATACRGQSGHDERGGCHRMLLGFGLTRGRRAPVACTGRFAAAGSGGLPGALGAGPRRAAMADRGSGAAGRGVRLGAVARRPVGTWPPVRVPASDEPGGWR